MDQRFLYPGSIVEYARPTENLNIESIANQFSKLSITPVDSKHVPLHQGPNMPTIEEVRAAIPREGIEWEDLVAQFTSSIDDEKSYDYFWQTVRLTLFVSSAGLWFTSYD